MNFCSTTILREAKSMCALRDSYEKQLLSLPKGSLQLKERNGKKYFYLSYRRDGKVVSEYIGNDESIVADLKERLNRRKNIENLLKRIKNELRLMNRALEVVR